MRVIPAQAGTLGASVKARGPGLRRDDNGVWSERSLPRIEGSADAAAFWPGSC